MLPGQIPYSRMSEEAPSELFPLKFKNLYWRLKALAQLQVFIGLVSLCLGCIADYQSVSAKGIRLIGVPEIAGLYFIATGIVGISGAASYRRGVMVAFMVMSVHACLLFVPGMIVTGLLSVKLAGDNCWMFRPESLMSINSFGVVCGQLADQVLMGNPDTMIRVTADRRIEMGLMAVAGVEGLMALLTAIQACFGICEAFGLVEPHLLHTVNKMTTTTRYAAYPAEAPTIQVPTVSRHIAVS